MLAAIPIAIAALFLSAIGLVFAIIALRRSQNAGAASRPAAAPPSNGPTPAQGFGAQTVSASQKAFVRVALVGTGRTHRVVVSNLGPALARQVTLSVEPRDGRSSPMVRADCDEKLPIAELAPGSEVSLLASVSSASGSAFDARLVWINADGSREGSATLIEAP